jgi:hypothetical protein
MPPPRTTPQHAHGQPAPAQRSDYPPPRNGGMAQQTSIPAPAFREVPREPTYGQQPVGGPSGGHQGGSHDRGSDPRGSDPRGQDARAQGASLTVVYNGDRVMVAKDRFIIGRGKQSSDLTLKDPNVSRQHAMVEYQNGAYFMVDMGSTNGVEFNGQRVARKQISEGDVYRICDHDLRFTYR